MVQKLDTTQISVLDTGSLIFFEGACAVFLVCFFLCAHPRWLGRCFSGSQAGELWKGFMFRQGKNTPARRHKTSPKLSPLGEKGYPFEQGFEKPLALTVHHRKTASKTFDTNLYPSTTLLYKPSTSSTNSSSSYSSGGYSLKPLTTSRFKHLPPFFPSIMPTVMILPLPRFLEKWAINLTIGQCLVLVGYFIISAGATLYYSNPILDPTRSGLLATAQIPIIVALGAKNSIVPIMVGKGNEKMNFLHRFIGRSIFILSTFHVGIYFHKYQQSNVFAEALGKPLVLWGFVAYIGLLLVTISSIPYIRTKAYQVFQVCHWIGFMMLILALIWHVPICVPFCASSLAVYGVDLLVRFAAKTTFTTAVLFPLPDQATTLVSIPSLTTGWRSGQFAYIRVLHPGMGLGKMWAAHPFTIASSGSEGTGEPLRFFIKNTETAGSWTGSLYGFARGGDEEIKYGGEGRPVTVVIDGPYGGTGNLLFSSFSSVLLFAGGSGITFPLAQASSLLAKSYKGLCRARTLDLVWVVREEAAVHAFLPYLIPLIEPNPPNLVDSLGVKIPTNSALIINIHVFITRPDPSGSALPRHPRLHIKTNRPNLQALVDAKLDETTRFVQRTAPHAAACGLGIGACGPGGFVRGVRDVVGALAAERSRACGGVELFAEMFDV